MHALVMISTLAFSVSSMIQVEINLFSSAYIRLEREDSVVSEFELTHSKKAHVANHFYSSNPSATEVFKDVSFSLTYDAYVEHSQSLFFFLKQSIK